MGCAAAARLAIPPACHPRARAPSGATVLGTRAQPRGDLEALAGHGHALLARRWPTSWGHRGRGVASALLRVPEHGPVEAAQHDEVCRRTAKRGTPHFFPSATASAVLRGRRAPLALWRVRATPTMDRVGRPLLERLVPVGLRLQLLWLDRGFSRGQVMQDLRTAALPCLRPAGNRGTKPTPPGGPRGP